MVNVSSYGAKESDYLNAELVKALPIGEARQAIIMPGSGLKDFTNSTPEGLVVNKRPWITISLNKKNYTWTLSNTAVSKFKSQLGSDETESWIGAVVLLDTSGQGEYETVFATVLKKPEGIAHQ